MDEDFQFTICLHYGGKFKNNPFRYDGEDTEARRLQPQPQARGNAGVSLETMVAASQGCRTRFEQYFST